MGNWSNPTISTAYTTFLSELKARDEDAATMFDVGTPSNVPTDAIKFAKSSGVFQKWNGSSWVTVQLKTAAIENLAITTGLINDLAVTNAKLAAGAAAANLGFTPAALTGATFTGAIQISMASPNLEFNETDNSNKKWGVNTNAGAFNLYEDTTGSPRISIAAGASALALGVGTLTYGGNTVWHSGNDGTTSGLDADTTDGQHLGTVNTPQFAGLGLGAAWNSAGILNITATGMTSNTTRRAAQIDASNTTQTLTAARTHHGFLSQFTNVHQDASGFLVTVIGAEVDANSGGVGVAGKVQDLVGIYAVTQNLTDQASNNTVVTATGVKSFLRANHANAAITTAYGVMSEINAASAGVIGTAFLFYGAYTGTAPTNNRGIRLVGEGYSQFDGSLGLGITPSQKLHVSGNALVTGTVTAGTQHFGPGTQAATAPDFAFTADPNTGMRSTGTADVLAFVTNGADRVTIDATGLVGINQAPATYRLGVNGSLNATTLNEGGTALTAIYARLGVANTFSVGGHSIAVGNAVSTALTVTSTEAGAADWPALLFDRQSSSPAASDVLMSIGFQGRNSGAVAKLYAALQAEIVDPTGSSEDGKLAFRTMVAGTDATRAYIAQGLVVGSPTGGDTGAGTINATALYYNGKNLAGKQTIILPASAFYPRTTNPAGAASFETATNKVMLKGWAFDAVTAEYVQTMFTMPKAWNKGTIDVTIRGIRHAGTGTSAARFEARAAILDSGDAMDIAFGTLVGVTITPNTTVDIAWEGVMASITPAGTTSAAQSTLVLQINRNPGDAADADATNDFILLEAFITYTTNAPTED